MNTKSEPVDIYKPKLSWFPYADSFLRKNYEYNAKLETNSVRLPKIFVFFYSSKLGRYLKISKII